MISKTKKTDYVVGIYSTVTIIFLDDLNEETYTIVKNSENLPKEEGQILEDADLAIALLGCKEGEIVSVDAFYSYKVKILKITGAVPKEIKNFEQYKDQMKLEKYEEQIFIKKFFNIFIEDTRKFLSSIHSVRDIDYFFKMHHKGVFNYEDLNEQTLYLLRYFYAYCYEYCNIFNILFQETNDLKVISVGCGAGIDALSLIYLIRNNKKRTFEYLGIDKVKWKHIDEIIKINNNIHFEKVELNSATSHFLENKNVLFFPKCLSNSDIDEDSMSNLIEGIRKVNFEQKKLFVCASYVTDGRGEVDPIQRKKYDNIIELLKDKNYIIPKDQIRNSIKTEDSKLIWKITSSADIFQKPDYLFDFFNKNIFNMCNKYKEDKTHCGYCFEQFVNENGDVDFSKKITLPKVKYGPIEYEITFLEKRN